MREKLTKYLNRNIVRLASLEKELKETSIDDPERGSVLARITEVEEYNLELKEILEIAK